jgi:hypothetical protein
VHTWYEDHRINQYGTLLMPPTPPLRHVVEKCRCSRPRRSCSVSEIT